MVTSDLWMSAAFKILKTASKPVVVSDVPAIPVRAQAQLANAEQALAETAAGSESAAPEPRPATDTLEARTPATPAARKLKTRAAKLKAPSAK